MRAAARGALVFVLAFLAVLPAARGAESSSSASSVFSGPLHELEIVRRALRDSLWGIAAHHAEKADAESPVQARLARLEALARAGRIEEVVTETERWRESSDAALRDGQRYWRAWAMVRLDRAAETAELLAEPFSSPSLQRLGLRLAARAAVQRGELALAARHFAEASAALADDPSGKTENALEWARALAAAGNAADAVATLEREGALAAAGVTGDLARLFAAELYVRLDRVDDSRRLVADLVAGSTNVDERAFTLAACLQAEDRWRAGATNDALRAATAAVARARQADLRRTAGYLLGFEETCLDERRAAGAARIRTLVREFPDEPASREAHRRLADSLLAAGDAAAAEAEYRLHQEIYPAAALDAEVLEGRGWALARLDRGVDAVGVFARAAQVATNAAVKARCEFKQADALVALGRPAEAAELYLRAAATDASCAENARLNAIAAWTKAGKRDEAEKLCRALVDDPSPKVSAEAALRLASAESTRGRGKEARALADGVLARTALAPDLRARAFAARGRANYRDYLFDAAAADFKAAAGLVPGRRDEMDFLVLLCLYGQGHDREARDAARGLLARAADAELKRELALWIAKCDFNAGDWKSAREGFEACAADPGLDAVRRTDALVWAARAAGAASDYRQVVELVSRAVKDAPANHPVVNEAMVLQAEALVELARFDEAVLVVERVLLANPDEEISRRAALLKADALFALGADNAARYREALDAYRALLAGERLSASARLAVAFKIGRTLGKLRRFDEEADQYYVNVVLAYGAGREKGEWFDDSARTFFSRAAFALADGYEAGGKYEAAVKVLKLVIASGVPAAEEARRRIEHVKTKGGLQ